mmetsp:Transcript_45305/g.105115  ORF Transcript_45305/g.105115 Transcript_45305/m.105115 type:complete len:230 (+) Transcript_45305:154-843(+)
MASVSNHIEMTRLRSVHLGCVPWCEPSLSTKSPRIPWISGHMALISRDVRSALCSSRNAIRLDGWELVLEWLDPISRVGAIHTIVFLIQAHIGHGIVHKVRLWICIWVANLSKVLCILQCLRSQGCVVLGLPLARSSVLARPHMWWWTEHLCGVKVILGLRNIRDRLLVDGFSESILGHVGLLLRANLAAVHVTRVHILLTRLQLRWHDFRRWNMESMLRRPFRNMSHC